MHDLSILEELHDEVDVDLCYIALLHGFWGQIWAYLESSKFYAVGDNSDSLHRLWLTTKHRELYRDIENFKEKLLTAAKQQPKLILTAELLLMSLHVSPEELQRFAGKSGEEAASQALTSLEKWSSTSHARKAIWHAGQVFRAAAVMPPAELRDFYAIAVYFASLTMWAYGYVTATTPPGSERSKAPSLPCRTPNSSHNISLVLLDGPETRETRAFVASGQGTPALSPASPRFTPSSHDGHVEFITLGDPNAVLKSARDLYRNNFPVLEEPLPPLVENMGNLLRDLSSLPESRFSRCPSPIEK